MTNKLPEIGKRYKDIATSKEYLCVSFSEERKNFVVLNSEENKRTPWTKELVYLPDFFEFFEELPDSQEKPEVQLNESIISEVEKAKEVLKYQSDCELAYSSFKSAVRKYEFRWAGMLQGNMADKEERIHPTQKPVRLYEWLLANYLTKSR